MTADQPVRDLHSIPRPLSRIGTDQRGAVLLLVLVAVTVLGLSAGIAGSTWTSIMQRAKEQDLLWKGGQIRQAIGSYYESQGAPGTPLAYPQSVNDLLQDNRSLKARRHLRQPYADPMTGEDWEWIKAPQGGIRGVRSTSQKQPFKVDGFSEENKKFAGMWQYRDGEFVYEPKKKAAPATPQQPGAQQLGTQQLGTPPSSVSAAEAEAEAEI